MGTEALASSRNELQKGRDHAAGVSLGDTKQISQPGSLFLFHLFRDSETILVSGPNKSGKQWSIRAIQSG